MELMVTLGVTGVAMAAATEFFMQQARTFARQSHRLETQQALRATLDNITRDVRLGGACLPTDGAFVSLTGVNDPAGDSITVRTGVVGTDNSCVKTNLNPSITANAGATTINVSNGTGFTAGMPIYLRHPNGSGEIHVLTGASGTVLTLAEGLEQGYTDGVGVTSGGVYAMDERVYALDKSDPDFPLLTLQANRGDVLAFAVGVHDLQVRYILDRNCPTCDVVDLPSSPVEWRLVNEVTVTATVKPVGTHHAADDVEFVAEARAKPRNLLP